MKTLSYKHTAAACYISYITGAVINNLAPLLFVTFSQSFGLSLEQLAKIITMNFGIQIVVDFVGAKFADKIGYRPLIIAAQAFAAAGLASLGTLPRLLDNAYLGIIISAALYAVGSGLMEVLISPIIEALPGDAKASSMSLLHSFYCWGQVLMVVLSTLFFKVFGIDIFIKSQFFRKPRIISKMENKIPHCFPAPLTDIVFGISHFITSMSAVSICFFHFYHSTRTGQKQEEKGASFCLT